MSRDLLYNLHFFRGKEMGRVKDLHAPCLL